MKVLCKSQVINRQAIALGARTPRPVKSTLALGFHSTSKNAQGSSKKELEILVFTGQNKTGKRFKVRDNIEKMFTKFVQDGCLTIFFKQPEENLMISCNPIELKAVLQTIKLAQEGKDLSHLRLNIAGATAIPKKSQPVQKLSVLKRSDYPTKGFPKTLKCLSLCGIKLTKITFEICSLRNLTTLDLSYNRIERVPPEMGRLSLVELHLNNNVLGKTNDWKWLQGANLRNSLRELDMSCNELKYFPLPLIKLKQLVTLKLNHNSLRRVPFGVRRLRNLRYIHISCNDLVSLPATFNDTRLELLDVWQNNFRPHAEHDFSDQFPRLTEVSPLWLQAARVVTAAKLPYSSASLPWVLVDILSESPRCACGKLCYAGTVLERAAMATFDNVKELVFSRDRLIYADIVLCGPNCAGRRQVYA